MKQLTVDVAVIGGGTAGLSAYRAAKQHANHVVMIEGGPFGTTCARVGCMPSKLLIAAAEASHQAQSTDAFGVHIEGAVVVDSKQVMARVKSERDRFVGFVVEGVDSIPSEDKIEGYAKFVGTHTLQVDGHTQIHAERIVIATGSRPAYPQVWNELGDRLVVNDDIFDWDDLPASIAIFGPGVIGLELGQALHRLGVQVHMFGVGGNVGPLTDPAVREYATQTFKHEFPLYPDVKLEHMKRNGNAVDIRYVDDHGTLQDIKVNYVIAATGRRPNVDKLALESLSLDLDSKGVPIADPLTMQSSMPHIFIAGDASNQLPLLHEAADQGRIAGDNAGRYPTLQNGLRRSAISVVFSDPQIAMIGMTYQEAQRRLGACNCLVIGEVSFENQGRSRVMLKNKGLLRIYAEQGTGILMGAEMIGPAAEHLAHLLAWAHQQQMTIAQMLDMPFYHPVIEEGVRTALRSAADQLDSNSDCATTCMECEQEGMA
ncbi:dihydrolipoyl dehydrogenase [Echinimonas agarilytica]|uniref:dihydrolipoyl dehydrogenase n=1 Tax=Echinimonas agarilytica TaxID=1215918 RepID=UPI0025580CEA|nr:dihydrolipoyl dehydrogenase [Echinimonas agarilytica]